jgi:hypothetical protein
MVKFSYMMYWTQLELEPENVEKVLSSFAVLFTPLIIITTGSTFAGCN